MNIRSKYTHQDIQFVRFSLASSEFGINVRNVKEIIRLRQIEKAPDVPIFLDGFIRLRSMSVPVLDLRKRFGFPATATDASRIIIALIEGRIAGLVVDDVSDIIMGGKEMKYRDGGRTGPWEGCLEAVVEAGGRPVMVLDPILLMSEEEKLLLNAPLPDRSPVPSGGKR